jgi:WhiB family transcriptional regulator, redox-sensing transcriptional regulator
MSGAGRALSAFMSSNAAPQIVDFFDEAACKDADTSVFFPVSDTFAGDAKAICATCPVAEQCLEYAISSHQSDGVWGGLTAVERHRLVRRRQKVAREQRERSTAA